jgi:hypothetical protein
MLPGKGELLVVDDASQRNDEPPSFFQLFDQGRRDMIWSSRDEDCIERSDFLPSEISVPVFDSNVLIPHLL